MTGRDALKPGLRHTATIRVGEQLAVPAPGRLLGATIDMPPVFAMASMIAFVERTQPTGVGKAAITGDFVLVAREAAPLMKASRDNGIGVTALHNHRLANRTKGGGNR